MCNPGLGHSAHEGCETAGEDPEAGHKDDPKAGAPLLRRQAKEVGLI